MSTSVFWCHDSDDLNQAVRIMESRQVRRRPVIHENKKSVGIVSLGNVSHAASQRIAAEIAKSVLAPPHLGSALAVRLLPQGNPWIPKDGFIRVRW